jgi:D-alanyl-D-alanine carboxypeptidase
MALTLIVALAGCAPASNDTKAVGAGDPSVPSATSPSPSESVEGFPTELFADLGEEPVSDALAAELQKALDASANGHGLTAAVISPEGNWNGATGFAAEDRAMVPNDQMPIAHITQTIVAAQVMQLVETGNLSLDDLAADRLPPGLGFDTSGVSIADLLSHRSGLPETLHARHWGKRLTTDPQHAWTIDELLGTVGPERGPVVTNFEYRGINYVLLGLIVEHDTGRSLADVLRDGVLKGDGSDRLIYQPDERPTDPMAMPAGASGDTLNEVGGSLPSLAFATAYKAEGAMAADSPSLARWFRGLCAGEVVSAPSLNEMTDFTKRPEYGLGLADERGEYSWDSGAVGHTGSAQDGYTSAAQCFQQQGIVVVVMANAAHDVDTVVGDLWRAVST